MYLTILWSFYQKSNDEGEISKTFYVVFVAMNRFWNFKI